MVAGLSTCLNKNVKLFGDRRSSREGTGMLMGSSVSNSETGDRKSVFKKKNKFLHVSLFEHRIRFPSYNCVNLLLQASSPSRTPLKPSPQHKVRGATVQDRTLDSMFPPTSHPAHQARIQSQAQAQQASSSSSSSAVVGPPVQTLQDDPESDEGNGNDGLGVSVSVPSPSIGKGKGRAIVRSKDSKCFLQSVLELRAEIKKAKHERTYFFSFSLVPTID